MFLTNQWSEAELRTALNSIRDGAFLVLDAKGRILRSNDAALCLFGYTAEEMIGRDSVLLFTPEDQALGVPRREMLDAATTGRANDDRYLVRKDGSRFFANGVLTGLRDADGDVTGYVKVIFDVSRRHSAEEANRALAGEVAEGRTHQDEMRRLLYGLIAAQEEERRRIARDLHDHTGQQMTALHLQLASIVRQLRNDPGAALERLGEVQKLAAQLDKDLDFYTWELRPGVLYNLGLVAALTDFVSAFSQAYALPVAFECLNVSDADYSSTLKSTCIGFRKRP